jgi:Acetyltransferase (GNAT) domain
MITVAPYDGTRREAWDRFVTEAKNGTFLFQRAYMEYHADRFTDASLLFFDDDALVALLPASRHGEDVVSHGGLTFGGIVSGPRMRAATVLEVFDALREHLRANGVQKLVYKRVPYIYHHVPADEDLYALFRHDAVITRRDLSAAVLMSERLPYTKGRKYGVSRSRKAGLTIERTYDFAAFMELEERHLQERFGTKPVHSAAEMTMLAGRFPDNIKLFTATRDGALLAGVIVYQSRHVAHTQYIATTEEGREWCALDAIIDHLLNVYYAGIRYFDFGTSNEQAGRVLNAGLIDNKESYGARGVAHEFFELTV